MKVTTFLAAALVLPALLVGCGDDSGSSTSSAGRSAETGPVVVSAAASLQSAFTAYGEARDGDRPRFSFAGSDALAAQIRAGARPDVFAAANTALPEALFAEGLVERPVVFAGNRLVLAVPAGDGTADAGSAGGSDDAGARDDEGDPVGPRVASLEDAGARGVKVAIGSPSVPIGAYARKVLGRLPAAERRAIEANVRTREPDVKGIVGKLTQGAVDAGFVYVTDVAASKGALRAIELPAELQPSAAYGVAVVKGAEHPAAARTFIAGLLDGEGRTALAAAGFEAPPTAR